MSSYPYGKGSEPQGQRRSFKQQAPVKEMYPPYHPCANDDEQQTPQPSDRHVDLGNLWTTSGKYPPAEDDEIKTLGNFHDKDRLEKLSTKQLWHCHPFYALTAVGRVVRSQYKLLKAEKEFEEARAELEKAKSAAERASREIELERTLL